MKNYQFEMSLKSPDGVKEIQALELSKHLEQVHLIDVRRPDELVGELGHITGAEMHTLETELATFLQTVPADKKNDTFVFICKVGGRSARATAAAMQLGFTNAYNLMGGMTYWNELGLKTEKTASPTPAR